MFLKMKIREIYFKKIRPSTTDLYSDASMLPRKTHAASQICFSNPMPAVFLSAISIPPSSHALGIFCYVNSTIILRVRQFTISIFESTQQKKLRIYILDPVKNKSNFLQKVGFISSFNLAKIGTNPTANPTGILNHSVLRQKVRKTPDFLSKSGVFMVAEAGLEPTTSGL